MSGKTAYVALRADNVFMPEFSKALFIPPQGVREIPLISEISERN